jgi:hypothetical protein
LLYCVIVDVALKKLLIEASTATLTTLTTISTISTAITIISMITTLSPHPALQESIQTAIEITIMEAIVEVMTTTMAIQ